MTSLVLFSGMMCDHRLFARQTSDLAGLTDVRIGDLTRDDTVEAMAERVLAEAPDRFSLAGLSLGGIVVLEILRRSTGRVERVALMDTNHRAEVPARREQRAPQIARVLGEGLRAVIADEISPFYLYAGGENDVVILDLVLRMALDLGAAVFDRQSRALRDRPDQTDTLRSAGCPVLFVCGAHDVLCPVALHREMACLTPGACLEIIAGAGHLPVLESPDAVGAILGRWLAGPPSS